MSTNEELPPPPKPRASPLDFRNTDLVSRLLAATPPYLYNMPMVPNSYFFSEMLKSFVQAKADANRVAAPAHHRRSRKRSWTQSRAEYYQKESPKADKPEVPSPNWNLKPPERTTYFDNKPLELTMDKAPLNSNIINNNRINELDYHNQKMLPSTSIRMDQMDKTGIPNPHNNMPMMFPNMQQNQTQESNQNLILPPPPPMWYPPIYPPPYGIDPLHFFIDLRVSGHIYDRKNGKESPTNATHTGPTEEILTPPMEGFKQSRHASAFSVPITSTSKNIPINLSSNKHEYAEPKENKPLKFDVKSMGFEKASNKTSANYVMNNISRIYRELNEQNQITYKSEPEEIRPESNEPNRSEEKEETEEEKAKRVKDLRALIGLELVVDYMNHAKPGQQLQTTSEDSTSDNESAASPALEVVAIQEDIPQGI